MTTANPALAPVIANTADVLLDRLASANLSSDVQDMVLAALDGEATLNAHLQSTERLPRPIPKAVAGSTSTIQPNESYLERITVEGFRGIGQSRSIDLHPGNGITLIEGRNGAGKSSFAEGVEALLVGKSSRFENRTADWKRGWRNLHHPTAKVTAQFTLPGSGPAVVRRTWNDDVSDFEKSTLEVQISGAKVDRPDAMGWEQALETFRPFLSYNDLSRSFDKPSELYDIVSKLLGLDELPGIEALLKDARKPLEELAKRADAARAALVALLGTSTDQRANDVRSALGAKRGKENAAALNAFISNGANSPQLDTGRGLLGIQAPTLEQVRQILDEIGNVQSQTVTLDASNADRSIALANLVDAALGYHQHLDSAGHSDSTVHRDSTGHGDSTGVEAPDSAACPVCLTPMVLTEEWRSNAQLRVAEIRSSTRQHAELRSRLQELVRNLHSVTSPPAAIGGASHPASQHLLDAAASSWAAFAAMTNSASTGSESPGSLDDIVGAHSVLESDLAALQLFVSSSIDDAESAWQPIHNSLFVFLAVLQPAERADADVKLLKAGAQWVTGAGNELRNERFGVIKDEVHQFWNMLRLGSTVSLTSLELSGSKTSRQLQLGVKVDEIDSAALSVVSQGELHALALAVFLPRPLRPESPFRFLIIDDPVQAMDPARVEGLALLLQRVAKVRQVLVFTHDNRLADHCAGSRSSIRPSRSVDWQGLMFRPRCGSNHGPSSSNARTKSPEM